MLISEKAIRLFARSILFENSETLNILEMNMSPSTSVDANAMYLNGLNIHDRPYRQTDWQEEQDGNNIDKSNDNINISDVSSSYNNHNKDKRDEGINNKHDLQRKVSDDISYIGHDKSNGELDRVYNKIKKILEDI